MRILVAPLDWGLGHATRCIPIIRTLHGMGHEVVLAANGAGKNLLSNEFPELESVVLPSYAMRYTKSRALLPLWLLVQLPFFIVSMLRERLVVSRLIKEYRIDRIISDSRYGVRSRKTACVFITHQLQIIPPGPRWLVALLSPLVLWLNRFLLKGFSEIWVPDFPGAKNLSGKLGHVSFDWTQVRYIHPLCRFRPDNLPWNVPLKMGESEQLKLDVLAIVSGPEPQRTLFEERLMRSLEKTSGTRVLVRGLPATGAVGANSRSFLQPRSDDLNIFDHLPGKALTQFMSTAERVVCRSGYTTVMELAGLGKTNVLMVPTPGQSEQEYLAEHLRAMGCVAVQLQETFELETGLKPAEESSGFGTMLESADSKTDSWNLEAWLHEHPLFHTPKRLAGKFVL